MTSVAEITAASVAGDRLAPLQIAPPEDEWPKEAGRPKESEPFWVRVPCMVLFLGSVPSDSANASYPIFCRASVEIPASQVDLISTNSIDHSALSLRYTQQEIFPGSLRMDPTQAFMINKHAGTMTPISRYPEDAARVLVSNAGQPRQGMMLIQVENGWSPESLPIPFGFPDPTDHGRSRNSGDVVNKWLSGFVGLRQGRVVERAPTPRPDYRAINRRHWKEFLPILAWLVYTQELHAQAPTARQSNTSPETGLPEYQIDRRRLKQIELSLQDCYDSSTRGDTDYIGSLSASSVSVFLSRANCYLDWSKFGMFV